MRRTLPPVLTVLTLLAAGCGSGSGSATLTPAQMVRAAAHTANATSSRLDLSSHTLAQGQDVVFKGTGLFGTLAGSPVGEMNLTVGPATIKEVIVGGVLYLQAPGQVKYYALPLSELGGTSLADSANPGSSAELLAAIGDATTKEGTETIHGAVTTHYKGVISIVRATALAKTEYSRKAIQRLADNGVKELPVDVYLDAKGRLRRLIQHVSMTIKGTKADSTTQIDLYDFGVAIHVQKPPASQIQDGSAVLKSLKSQFG